MGLFDKIKIDSRFKTKLTKSNIKAIDKAIGLNDFNFEYQTKDLQCWMQDYYIDIKGRLYIYTDDKDRRKRKRDHYTGTLELWTIITNDELDHDLDVTHEIVSTKGVCKCIKSYIEKRCNKTRISNEIQFEKNRRKYDALRKTLRYKVYFNVYKRPIRYVLRSICKMCSAIQTLCGRVQLKLFPW